MAKELKEKEKVLHQQVETFRTIQKGNLQLYFQSYNYQYLFSLHSLLDLQKSVLARKQLDSQLTENKNVKEVSL